MIGQLDRIRELEELHNASNNNFKKNIVAVTSGKGGTGKTFFAANFAFEYAKHSKVLLIDLDFNLSNLHLLLNIHPKNTLSDFFQSKCLLKDLVTPYNSNLDVVYGDSGLTNNDKPSSNEINKLLSEINNIANKYDIILLDLGAGINDENIGVLKKTNLKIIVTNPEPTALMDAYVLVKILQSTKNDDNCYVVVNRIIDENEGEQAFKNLNSAVEHFLRSQVKFLADVPESKEVRKSIVDQKLLSVGSPKSVVINSIKLAAEKIYKILQVLNINQPSVSSPY